MNTYLVDYYILFTNMGSDIPTLFEDYIADFPEKTDQYITKALIGYEIPLTQAHKRLHTMLTSRDSSIDSTATKYRLREWKAFIEKLHPLPRNTYPIKQQRNGQTTQRGFVTTYELNDQYIVITSLFNSATESSTTIKQLKCTTVSDPEYFFTTKLRSNGWERPTTQQMA